MIEEENLGPALLSEASKKPVVREGELEGSSYRIETYHEPEEL
jgi:hypothetical protein